MSLLINSSTSIIIPENNGNCCGKHDIPKICVMMLGTHRGEIAFTQVMVSGSADGNWRCHTGDCNTPTQVMNKRASTCCNLLTPLLQAIDRCVCLPCDTPFLIEGT